MNKTFDDFVKLLTAVLVELSEHPGIKIDSQFAEYDGSRHRIRVAVSTNRGDSFFGEFPPECGPDLLRDEAAVFTAAIRCHLKQQLALVSSVAAQAHALAWKADHARRGQSH
jgi:hypothetical protein